MGRLVEVSMGSRRETFKGVEDDVESSCDPSQLRILDTDTIRGTLTSNSVRRRDVKLCGCQCWKRNRCEQDVDGDYVCKVLRTLHKRKNRSQDYPMLHFFRIITKIGR